MNVVISVIIPIYNCERYLNRCVNSVLNQSYKNYELILIDDGSIDASGEMCDQYAEKDERIVVIHQKNQGVSAARNAGIEKSSGKYIVFIDSDDFVENDFLYRLNQSDADLVMVGFCDYLNNKVLNVIVEDEKSWSAKSDKGIEEFLKSKSASVVWGKRYKKSILDEYKIRFRKDLSFCEDRIFNNDYILMSDIVVNIKWSGYYYCKRNDFNLTCVAKGLSFVQRMHWKRIAFNQFKNYPLVKKMYASQILYYSEEEIVSISKSKLSIPIKCVEIKRIIDDEIFQECMQLMPEKLPRDVRFYCRHKLTLLLIIKYYKSGLKNKWMKKI